MVRYFIPTKPKNTSVYYWSYTKSRGLMVIFNDNFKMKSSYSLKELLNSCHFQGDGLPCKEIQKKPSSY